MDDLKELIDHPSCCWGYIDELRKMDGEPVWVVAGDVSWWDIVSFSVQDWLYLARGEELRYSRYGEWLAYRQKPEDGKV